MKFRTSAIFSNPFMREIDFSNYLTYHNLVFDHMFYHTENELSFLQNKEFVYVLMDYGKWTHTTDIFKYIKPKMLNKIRKGKCYFIFDASNEGYSPFFEFPFFDAVYHNCKEYNIDPKMVIYLSSNLKDEENIKRYCATKNTVPIHVFPFPAFENAVLPPIADVSTRPKQSQLKIIKNQVEEMYTGKFFSSLSRVNRPYRTMSTYFLTTSKIKDEGLVSHDVLSDGDLYALNHLVGPMGVTKEQTAEWQKCLPLTIDRSDFRTNWAVHTDYSDLYAQTVFHIVNETHVNNHQGTALFYSEKTFRPLMLCQPFLIWGQAGCNRQLETLGYQPLDEYFDLSFDNEIDPRKRYKMLLKTIEDTCDMLRSMTREEQIEWRFKYSETLMYNYNVLVESRYTKTKLYNFYKTLAE